MHRLFVAIDPPRDVSEYLHGLSNPQLNARWVPRGNHHLTLKFLGYVETPLRDEVVKALGRIHANRPRVTLSELSAFPNLRRPSVLIVRIDDDGPLHELQRTVEKELHELRIERETKPFRPHITLARLKHAPAASVREFVSNQSLRRTTFTPDVFRLYESKLSSDGAQYTTVAEYPLHSPT